MHQSILDAVRALRSEPHNPAERPGEGKKTKARLMAFLRENTTPRLSDEGARFRALHAGPGAAETIAFRADTDALPRG